MPSQLNRIENHQEDAGTPLSALPELPRYWLGLVASSTLAYYTIQIVMALSGLFNVGLTNWLVHCVPIALLIAVNAIAKRFDKLFAANLLLGAIISCYMISLRMRIGFEDTLAQWRLVIAVISYFATALLNAWFLTRYLRATGLKSGR